MSEEERIDAESESGEPAGGQVPLETPAEGLAMTNAEPQEAKADAAPAPAPATPAYQPASQTGAPRQTTAAGGVSDDDRLMAALAWLSALILQVPLVSLVLLVAEPNRSRPFQRYHAVTSLALWAAAIAYELVAVVVYLVLGVLTLGIGLVCLWPIFLVPHVFALYYAYTAFVGRQPEIPLISDLVRRQGWV